jgi:hypothetical protein
MERTSTPPLRTTENTIRIVAALKELDGAGVTELATHLSLSKTPFTTTSRPSVATTT